MANRIFVPNRLLSGNYAAPDIAGPAIPSILPQPTVHRSFRTLQPRDEPAVLIADLDIDQRRDWLALFPFLTTRRPDAYGSLTAMADGPPAVTLQDPD